MPYWISSAWRILAYAAASVLVLAWLEHAARRRLPTVRGCVVAGLLLATLYSGFELVPYYMLGHCLSSGPRVVKNIIVEIGITVVFIVYVRFWIAEARRSRIGDDRLPEA